MLCTGIGPSSCEQGIAAFQQLDCARQRKRKDAQSQPSAGSSGSAAASQQTSGHGLSSELKAMPSADLKVPPAEGYRSRDLSAGLPQAAKRLQLEG